MFPGGKIPPLRATGLEQLTSLLQEMQEAPDPADTTKGKPGCWASRLGSRLALNSDGDSLHQGGGWGPPPRCCQGPSRRKREGRRQTGSRDKKCGQVSHFQKGCDTRTPCQRQPGQSLDAFAAQRVSPRALATRGRQGRLPASQRGKPAMERTAVMALPCGAPGHRRPDLEVTLREKEDTTQEPGSWETCSDSGV